MAKAKTTAAKDTKKADKPQENLCKCYVSSKTAGELDGSGQGSGESFWINKLSATRAEVRNNCFCGLCVGDIIEIIENGPNGWKNEFVKLVERKAELYAYKYDFPGMDKTDKFPKEVAEFIQSIKEKGIRFEGVFKGVAMLSRPKTMSLKDFRASLKGGPVTFTEMKD